MRKRLTIVEQAQKVLSSRPTKKGRPKKWENFTQQEKAVALAYDIIQSIIAGVYAAKTQYYIDTDKVREAAAIKARAPEFSDATYKQDVKELLDQGLLQNCDVCALGACYLSVVRFENHTTVSDLRWASFGAMHKWNTGVGDGRKRLIDALGYKMVDMLESAFERQPFYSIHTKERTAEYKASIKKAIAFGKEYKKEAKKTTEEVDTNRLLAIWMNVIKNNGVFKP